MGGTRFIGRQRELDSLIAGLDDAANGFGRVFLVGGEPGIGKSRLADEVATMARERGIRVLTGRCWEAGGAPTFWPWVQALRTYIRDESQQSLRAQLGSGAVELAQIMPEIRTVIDDLPELSPLDPEGARFRLFDATATFIRRIAQDSPLLIVLDDLHVADTPSLLLLQFVAREIARAGVVVVALHRDVDERSGDPLAAAIGELARESATRRLEVRGLTESDVATMVGLVTGADPPHRLVRAVHQHTAGNPLFVGEVVRLLADEGRLTWSGVDPFWRAAIPHTVRTVIDRRLQRLTDECVRVLTLASVVGRDFSLDILQHLGELDGADVVGLLDEAEGVGLVEEVAGGFARMRFSHAVVRETLYDGLAPARRRSLHRDVAGAIERLHVANLAPDLAQLAHHYFAAAYAGDADKAVSYAQRAGDAAMALFGYEEAIRLYQMSIEAMVVAQEADDRRRFDVLVALGEGQARAGQLAAAKATFLDSAAVARSTGLAEHLARAALGYGGRYVWGRAADDRFLIPLLEDALAALPVSDSAERVRLLGRLACARRSEPDREVGAAMSAEAVAMAERMGDPDTLAYALEAHHGASFWYDNPEQRLDLAAYQMLVAQRSGDKERIAHVYLCRTSALLELGQIEDAEAALDHLTRLAEELREPAYQAMATSIRAMLALFRGEFELAGELMLEERRVGEPALTAEAEAWFRAHDGWLRREQGRIEGLESVMRDSAERLAWYPMFRCFLAELYCELGRQSDARRIFEEFAANDFAGLLPSDNEWLLSASVLADVCGYLGDTERASSLYEKLTPVGHLNVVGLSELARGSAARSLGVLAATLGRFEVAEKHFRRAIDDNARFGARPWLARTQYELGRMLLACDRPGDRNAAIELLAVALDAARSMGMGPLAARIVAAGGAPLPTRATTRAVFRIEGEFWSIVYERDAFRLKDSKGMRHLARLLAVPGDEIHVLELAGAGGGVASSSHSAIDDDLHIGPLGDAGALLDERAKSAYRARIADCREELDEAERWNDSVRAERARAEIDFIARELSAAVGLGGRDRKASSPSERARVNVTRSIKAAMQRVSEHSPALGAHLARTIRTGTFCTYDSDPRVTPDWQI